MDFKSYMNSNSGKKPTAEDVERLKRNVSSDDLKRAKSVAAKYEGMSDAQLMSEIQNIAERSKKDGSLTDSEIRKFTETVSPMLSPEQRQKLGSIISMIKR